MNRSKKRPTLIRSETPCDLCGSHDAYVVGERDRDGSALRTVVSAKSGLVWTDPRPSTAEIDAFYAQLYRVDYKGVVEPKPGHVWRAGRVAKDRYARLAPFLEKKIRTLDVGSGGGEFVRHMLAHGKEARGLEPNEGYATWASGRLGLPVASGHWHTTDFTPESFDAITLFHVLEHLEKPFAAFVRFRSWLARDGILAIEVPNLESRIGSPQRRFHFAHLYNFNAAALEMLGRKAGFRPIHTEISQDTGNLTVIFQKTDTPENVTGEVPGNCARVLAHLSGYTESDYLLSPRTWFKPFGKIARVLGEKMAAKRYKDPVKLPDATL